MVVKADNNTMTEDKVKEDAIVPEQSSEMPDNQEETSDLPDNNTKLIEILNRFLPETDTSTPEGIMAASLKLLESFVPLHDKLYDLATTNPESASALSDWLETGSLVKAIARNYGEEERQALIEELEDESYEEDRNMYSEKTKKLKERESLLEKNKSNSQLGAQEFVDEVGATEEDIQKFIPFVDKFLTDCEDRNLTKDNWLIIWKAYRRDSDVEEAETNGRIMGRNEKIVAEKKSRNDIKDVLPEVNSSAQLTPKPERKKTFAEEFMDGVI